MTEEQNIKDHLAIEIIFKKAKGFRLSKKPSKKPYPIQRTPYKLGLHITNVGDTPFPGATISNLWIEAMPILQQIHKQIAIKALNPNEDTEVWLVETSIFYVDGINWIKSDLKSTDPSHTINTYQSIDVDFKQPPSGENHWRNFIHVQPRLELLQTRTNIWIMILTALIFVNTVFELETIKRNTLQTLGDFFGFISQLLKHLS